MSRALVLVWLGTLAGRAPHEADLAAFAASRMVTFEDPAGEAGLDAATHDDALAARIEGLLAEARTAGYGADSAAAEAALGSAELLLRGNPSLPEAGWLMAEVCRDHAALARSRDPDLSRILDARARALRALRVRAFGEPSGAATDAAVAADAESAAGAELAGPRANDEVEVDGLAIGPPRTIPPGEHHVRVIRRERLAWAGWVTPDAATFRVPLPGVVPCSETDFDRVRIGGSRVETGGHVLCPHWAAAREQAPERIEVSLCERNSCGTFLPWSRGWGEPLEGPMQPRWPQKRSTSWLPWALGSVAAAAAATLGTVALWQAGAFDREGPKQENLTFRVVRPPP